jgi:hypothetical protein
MRTRTELSSSYDDLKFGLSWSRSLVHSSIDLGIGYEVSRANDPGILRYHGYLKSSWPWLRSEHCATLEHDPGQVIVSCRAPFRD